MLYISIYWFTILLLSFMGVELANHPPKDDPEQRRWRRRFIVVGLMALGVTADIAYQQSREEDRIKGYGLGAKGPEIRVELNYGPTNGMNRRPDLAGNVPPVAVIVTNRSDLPILDMSLLMWAASPAFMATAQNFNDSAVVSTNIVPPHYSARVALPADYLTNLARFQFTSTTRAGRLDYDFTFLQKDNRWEHSNTIFDATTRTLILTDISPGFGQP